MFEFFIALFGGIYYATKYSADKKAKKRADKELKGLSEARQDLWGQLENVELENKLKKKISNERERQELAQRTDEVLSLFPPSLFNPTTVQGIKRQEKEMLFVLMVEAEYLPLTEIHLIEIDDSQDRVNARLLWAQSKLREKGIAISLVRKGALYSWEPYMLEETVK